MFSWDHFKYSKMKKIFCEWHIFCIPLTFLNLSLVIFPSHYEHVLRKRWEWPDPLRIQIPLHVFLKSLIFLVFVFSQ